MHGGIIYLRGKAKSLGKEIEEAQMEEKDYDRVTSIIDSYKDYFGVKDCSIEASDFVKLFPTSKRPYGRLYVQ
jgi:glutamate synthase domain-containing protein 3